MPIEAFQIDIPQAVLEDLERRLAQTRWPDEIEAAGWDYGTHLTYLKELTTYWQQDYDWRQHEAALNTFQQFRTRVDGFGLHFVHEKGKGPAPLPLLMTHGWPDSFWRFYKVIPMLTDPKRFGGNPADAFDVIVPSIPGYGFSDKPTRRGMSDVKVAELFSGLMEELGYEHYGAHGGDWGSSITEALAAFHPEALVGIHLTDIPYWHRFSMQLGELSQEEQQYIKQGQDWTMSEGAYSLIQGTKPQTLAYGLSDSPVGLASWLVEKFRSWSDCDGEIESRFSKNELLTNIFLYWATNTINSANRIYFESPRSLDIQGRLEVPTGVAMFPKDLLPAPRTSGERFFNIQRWSEMPRGGHFAALEEPELLARELRAFFRPYRMAPKK